MVIGESVEIFYDLSAQFLAIRQDDVQLIPMKPFASFVPFCFGFLKIRVMHEVYGDHVFSASDSSHRKIFAGIFALNNFLAEVVFEIAAELHEICGTEVQVYGRGIESHFEVMHDERADAITSDD